MIRSWINLNLIDMLSDNVMKARTISFKNLSHYLLNHLFIITFVCSLLINNVSASSDCSFQQFECVDKSKCIPISWECDGDVDCPDKSDETNCAIKKCADNEFKCQNGKCLPQKWVCDGENDCGDLSDEANCSNHTCAQNQFKCLASSNCIPNEWLCDDQNDCSDGSDEYSEHCKTTLVSCRQNEFTCDNGKCLVNRWVCDGENDCGDGSDESSHLCANQTCTSGMFTCKSGKCIPERWRCDRDRDCHDGDDEQGCDFDKKEVESLCGPREFMCENGHECIHMHWRCDHSNDCTDNSDEKNCNYTCRADQFQCNSGHCIPDRMKCNGENECPDGSDEDNCPPRTTDSPVSNSTMCTATQHRCEHSSKCIALSKLCDGFNDCGDWSDEPPNCSVNECDGNHHCSQICIDDFSGYHCECKKGFRLADDKKTCDDIDECTENYGLCSGHICLNLKGHFKCECFDGYEVKDHRFCKAKGEEKPLLMFANRHDIRTLDVSQKQKHQHYNSLYSQLRSTIAVDYSLKDNYLIWSDVALEKFFMAPFDSKRKTYNGIKEPHELIDNRGIVDALAVDWIHRLLYWTDTSKDCIEVANITNPESRTVIVSDRLEEPRGIAINVMESWIVWTDWGSSPKIERSLQDGSERQLLVDSNIIWPNGVTIDLITKRIYWLDAKLNTLSAIDYDGKNRRLILHSTEYIRHPFSLDIFEDTVYWTDWELESVLSTNKFGTEVNKIDSLVGGVFSVMDIRVVHSYKRPNTTNRCSSALCSHLCLPTGQHSYRCACPPLMVLRNNSTCESLKPSIVTQSPKLSTTVSTTITSTSKPSLVPSSSTQSTVESLEEIEMIKSHDRNKTFDKSDSNLKMNDYSIGDQPEGKLAIIITVVLLTISLIIGTLVLFIYRKYQRRNITSMNFDNPVYRKTTEDQFVLEKSDDSISSYPSSLEPLTSPGTNEFV